MANNDRRRRRGWGGMINLTAPGTAFTFGFIILAIGFGILFSRGVTPKYRLTEPNFQEEYEMVPLTPDPIRKGLQLKTLKFRSCANTVTMDLLLDRSGSMSERTPTGETKLIRLTEAVKALIEGSNDNTIIGIQSFNSPDGGLIPIPNVTNDVPISFYKDIKDLINPALDSFRPAGATPTYEALKFSRDRLKEALDKNEFKNRKFNFILVSDGAPCPGVGCAGNPGDDQDPRKYDPNPADEIKALGVNVFTVGIFSTTDQNPALADLLRSIASEPENYFAANTGDDVKNLLKQISNRICAENN